MDKDVRQIGLDRVNEMFALASYAFNVEATEKRKHRFEEIIQHSMSYGCFKNDELVSQLISTSFKINFHGVKYKMAGIGCVSSYPEYRGDGCVSSIMKVLLKDLAEQEVSLAYLAPFSYPFYRKYGFEQTFERIKYTIQAENWPAATSVSGTVRRVSWEKAKETIQVIYPKLNKYQRGALIREVWWLDYAFSLTDISYQFAIYENAKSEVEGYLIYQSSAELFTIKEWAYLTKNAFQAFSKFVGSHVSSSSKFYYETGFDGKNLSYLFPAPTIKMEIKPDMMARIIDFSIFLKSYPFLKGKQEVYYLEIKDDYGFWNDGKWEVNIDEAGQASVKKITTEANISSYNKNIVSGSIQSWTQLFMGYQSTNELYFQDKLLGIEELVYSFGGRIPKGKPILEDHF
ncbi:GNAT family N-acetyltransferase [Enterococcus rivorum]|uniref:GNAT family N-acetyltransferase n=2 Tax=Enterococcus rivorum TaxID=762845 RepID=A0A1E5KVA5_9ENTE|nr:GNAT family N-acetyltransferase [Enterococcus rivorum]MBP2098387.1 putative acetyltransferase [Enterococcus rivorum]OEH81827.1 GNAT family N-acetyltransferase [Enterococcus rivorum]